MVNINFKYLIKRRDLICINTYFFNQIIELSILIFKDTGKIIHFWANDKQKYCSNKNNLSPL